MNKEKEITRVLCDVLREICETTDITDIDELPKYGNSAIYIPRLRRVPTFVFTEEDIELIKEIAEQEGEDFSVLTD